MTHYLVMADMPPENIDYMLHDLKLQEFRIDKDFCKKFELCRCVDTAKAHVREIRFFEIEVYTPATRDFEKWLGHWSFNDLAKGAVALHDKNYWKPRFYKPMNITNKLKFHFQQFLNSVIIKMFYFIMTKMMNKQFAPFADMRYKKTGTIYRPFAPMSKRFPDEPTDKYETQSQFNCRNIVFGKRIEHPVGSYTKSEKECPTCGALNKSAD